MSTIQFIPLEPEQLQKQIAATVKTELVEFFKENKAQHPNDWLTREDLRDMLKISISTVNNWKKLGIITAYGMGNRVYFRRSEVESMLKPLVI